MRSSEDKQHYSLAFIALWLFVFSVPFENMLVVPGVGTINRLFGMICVALAVYSVCKNGTFRNPGHMLFSFMLFVLWSMTTYYWSIDPERGNIDLRTLVQLFVFTWLIWEFSRGKRTQRALLVAYVTGSYVAIGSILYSYVQGVQSTWFRYSALGFDPNDVALTIALGVPIAWHLGLTATRKYLLPCYYGYLPLAFFAITLTASRTAFLALFVASLYLVWTFSSASKLTKVTSVVMLLAAICLFAFVAPDYSIERLGTVFTDITEGRLNAREVIWSKGLQVFTENPILGVGVGGFRESIEYYRVGGFASHNLFLSILVGQGLIGLVLFLLVLTCSALHLPKMPVLQSRMWVTVLLTWFVGVMALSWAYTKPTWFIIAMLAVQGASAAEEDGMRDLKLSEVLP